MLSLHFPRVLTSEAIETKLRRHLYSGARGSWNPQARTGLFFDLSKVEFAEFSSLAQVALLVEGAARHGIPTRIALPLTTLRRSEAAFAEANSWARGRIERSRNHRQLARTFMQRSGFVELLALEHIPEPLCEVISDFDSSERSEEEEVTTGAGGPDNAFAPYTVRNILPLRWIAADAPLDSWRAQAVSTLSRDNLLDSQHDAAALVDTVLNELIDNVGTHAHDGAAIPPSALVGAIGLDDDRYSLTDTNVPPVWKDYASWAARQSSPVVRLIVGDSGCGIVERLAPSFSYGHIEELPRQARDWREGEQIALWAMEPWSTSRSSDEARLVEAVRGLARVRRYVRHHFGAISIRTRDTMVGWTHQPTTDGRRHPVRSSEPLASTPGTLVDVCFLPGVANESYLSAVRDLVRSPAEPTAVLLEHCTIDSDGLPSFTPGDLHSATGAGGNRSIIVAVLDSWPTDNIDRHRFFAQLLQIATAVAEGARFGVLCTTATRPQIDIVLQSIDQARERSYHERGDSTDRPEPVLFFDRRGEPSWAGGDRKTRDLLVALTRGEAVDRALVHDRSLQLAGDWLEVRDEQLHLSIDPHSVRDRIAERVVETLTDSLQAGYGKSPSHAVRSPTLEVLDRWLDAETWISSTVGIGAASFALATKLIATHPSLATDAGTVIVVGSQRREVGDALRLALGWKGPVYSMSGEVGRHDDPEAVLPRANSRVLVITDVLVSANTAHCDMRDLIKAGIEIQALVAIVDVRRDRGEDTIECMGRSIPVYSLLHHDFSSCSTQQLSNVKDIDPTTRSTTTPLGIQQSDYAIEPTEFLQLCARSQRSLLAGHIARAKRRHFSTFPNVAALLDIPEAAQALVDSTTAVVSDWLDGERDVEIWCPGPEGDVALRLAYATAMKLRTDGCSVRVVGVERTARGGRRVLTAPPQSGFHGAVVCLDWGSLSTSTANQLLGIAAQAGASRLLLLLLTSQLPVDEEEALARVSSVRVRQLRQVASTPGALALGTEAVDAEVSVRVRFITRLHVGVAPAVDCDLCALERAYRVAIDTSPTALLSRHATTMADRLRPMDRATALAGTIDNAIGGGLTELDVSQILDVRRELDLATRQVSARAGLLERLSVVPQGASDIWMLSLLHLLELEPRWLRLSPLRFHDFRDLLARNSISLAMSRDPHLLPDDRLRAIHLARSSSKHSFMDQLVEMFTAVRNDPLLVDALLFGVLSYLDRPYHQQEALLSLALERLREIERTLPALRGDQASQPAVSETVSALLRLAEYRLDSLGPRELELHDALSTLRDHFARPLLDHLEVGQSILSVRIALSPEGPLPAEHADWREVRDDWTACETFLRRKLLPTLPAIRPLLVPELYKSMHASQEDEAAITRWCHPTALRELTDIGSSLAQLSGFQTADREEQIAATRARIEDWFALALSPGEGRRPLRYPTAGLLPELVMESFTNLRTVIDEVNSGLPIEMQSRLRIRVIEFDPRIEVLCLRRYVVFVYRHALTNIVDHPSDPCPTHFDVEVEILDHGSRVGMAIRNTGTEAGDTAARDADNEGGIERMRRRLGSYGAELAVDTPPVVDGADLNWSFELAVDFATGRRPISSAEGK